MSDENQPRERNDNIWAPWRMEYMDMLAGPKDECFLCRYRDNPTDDAANFVLWRGEKSFAVLNRFPYTGGHTMVSPYEHVGEMDAIDDATLLEMMHMTRDLPKVMTRALRAEGFNVGVNIGKCSGAGLPGHLHIHVVPRWTGDTNFMPVFGKVRIIPQTLDKLREAFLSAAGDLKLPYKIA